MKDGKVLTAEHEGTFVLKMIGDVRLTLCATLDEYISSILKAPNFVGVIIDLSEAEGIDSTSLGMMAKLAVMTKKHFQHTPIIFSPNPDITHLLNSMGFSKVFEICESLDKPIEEELGELELLAEDENCVRTKIIEAHKVLMDLNSENEAAFSSLVSTLENSA